MVQKREQQYGGGKSWSIRIGQGQKRQNRSEKGHSGHGEGSDREVETDLGEGPPSEREGQASPPSELMVKVYVPPSELEGQVAQDEEG